MQNYCVRCGNKLLPGAGYCTGCGAPVLSFASDKLERGVNTVSFMLMGAQLASDISTKGINASDTAVNFYKNVLSNSNNLYSALNGAGSAAVIVRFTCVRVE